jgi:signal transduction histidine kinase
MLNQEKLRKYSEELEVLNATKDKFFSIIAHDLKSPFNAFLGITEILSEDIDILDRSQIKAFVVDLNRSANNQFKLLENLLAWAQIQRGAMPFLPINLNLHAVIDEVFQLYLDNAIEKGITFVNLSDPIFRLLVDQNMIYLLLRNLVYNAIKFTNKGGKIEVGFTIIDNLIEIFVADDGVGISEKAMAKLFRIDNQSTTLGTASEKGTGLGLMLCKEMVEKNGGSVRVSSKLGVGTIFYFCLPI